MLKRIITNRASYLMIFSTIFLVLFLLLDININTPFYAPLLHLYYLYDTRSEELVKKNLISIRNHIKYKDFSIYYLDADRNLMPNTKTAFNRAIQLNKDYHVDPDNMPSPDL